MISPIGAMCARSHRRRGGRRVTSRAPGAGSSGGEGAMGRPQRITGWHQEITKLQLRLKMRQILTGPECDKIDFTLGSTGVSRFTFRNVANGLMQIEQGKPEFDKIEQVYKQKVS